MKIKFLTSDSYTNAVISRVFYTSNWPDAILINNTINPLRGDAAAMFRTVLRVRLAYKYYIP